MFYRTMWMWMSLWVFVDRFFVAWMRASEGRIRGARSVAFPLPNVLATCPACVKCPSPHPPWKLRPDRAHHALNSASISGESNHVSRRSPRSALLITPRTPRGLQRRTLQLPRRREASIPTRTERFTRWNGRALPSSTPGAGRRRLPIP